MKNNKIFRLIASLFLLVVFLLSIQACKTYFFRSNYLNENDLLHETNSLLTKPFLKAHLINGDVCIFRDTWQVDSLQTFVSGVGTRYDFNRVELIDGSLIIALDSVAIFETNKKLENTEFGRMDALSILTAVDVLLGVVCILNPKACFGSCPTFYINDEDNFHYADAEGFSNAISPSLEYFDIDALNNETVCESLFSITMKNEALETHCVENVSLLAYPREKGERVYQSPDNSFYLCENDYQVVRATDNSGDISHLLKANDKLERFSLSDETNLSSKEDIYLTFENLKNTKNLGLIINFRQTLMTTYFIYSAIGYMGDEVGDIFAKMEIEHKTSGIQKNGIKEELGDIEVYTWSEKSNNWLLQSGFYETGPIAINQQILPLQSTEFGSSLSVKLVINKGLWRIDHLALTNIKEKVEPIKITPSNILNKGKLDQYALDKIIDPNSYLISMPGDEYKFIFNLPEENKDYELFLYSKGYYLEWMREHWIKDKDLLTLRQMIKYPKDYLRQTAGEYKQYESSMEFEFWNSKIDTKTFSYHEK